jgi:hypothetical protein
MLHGLGTSSQSVTLYQQHSASHTTIAVHLPAIIHPSRPHVISHHYTSLGLTERRALFTTNP